MSTENRDRMPEHEGVGPHLHLLEKEPDDALAIGQREGLGTLVELGEKPFEALGQRRPRRARPDPSRPVVLTAGSDVCTERRHDVR
jgi:hypothetical protein